MNFCSRSAQHPTDNKYYNFTWTIDEFSFSTGYNFEATAIEWAWNLICAIIGQASVSHF
jgi:hypothetical protein